MKAARRGCRHRHLGTAVRLLYSGASPLRITPHFLGGKRCISSPGNAASPQCDGRDLEPPSTYKNNMIAASPARLTSTSNPIIRCATSTAWAMAAMMIATARLLHETPDS